MSNETPQPVGTPEEQTQHRPPAPTPAEHNDRFRQTHPNDLVGGR